MKRKIIFALIFICLFSAVVSAETSIKAEVDKSRISVGQPMTYKISITSDEKEVPKPEMPKFAGFRVLSRAESSTISFSGGGRKIHLVYAFILSAPKEGKIRIEPAVIKAGKQRYATESFEIEVTPGKAMPKAAPQAPALPKIPQPETESPEPQVTL